EIFQNLIGRNAPRDRELSRVADVRVASDIKQGIAEIAWPQVEPIDSPDLAHVNGIILRQRLAKGAAKSEAERLEGARADCASVVDHRVLACVGDHVAEPGHIS